MFTPYIRMNKRRVPHKFKELKSLLKRILNGMEKIIKLAEYDLEALIDNELDQKKYCEVLKSLENNPEALKKYKALFRQKLLLKRWWKHEKKN